MNRNRIQIGAQLIVTILTGMTFTDAYAKKLDLGTKSPNQKRESLIWNVNQPITKIQVDVLGGRPIVNTVKIIGGPEFNVGAYFENGQNWSHDLNTTTPTGQIRVNVDKAVGSQVRLIVWTGSGNGTADATSRGSDPAKKRPTNKQESLLWEVHDSIRGFEVIVTEGRPIINTIKLLGGEEFAVGAYFEKGQSFRKDFDRTVQVGQLRVNVDKAIGSELKLVLHK